MLNEVAEVSYENVPVTLACKVALLNGIEQWKNVTYLIEWVAEGKALKREKICDVQQGKTHEDPCPNEAQIVSQLPGLNYTIGQRVRVDNFINLYTILYRTYKF